MKKILLFTIIAVLISISLILLTYELSDNKTVVQDKETETVFAIIGDYGDDTIYEKQVSELVHSWNPQFIVTTGDNNYHDGKFLDEDIGKYYSDFIGSCAAEESLGESSGPRPRGQPSRVRD